ncbi:MAG: hypothetical protein H7839_03765 [Magnetococcus sp. YQC-5]
MKLVLVSCVSKKQISSCRAADLYTSPWFRKARGLVESTADASWFILSAKYELLHPDTIIAPYNETLKNMSNDNRRAWASRVKHQMETELPDAQEVIILAGHHYRKFLLPYLKQRFINITIPMEKLRIGQQLSWLNAQQTL